MASLKKLDDIRRGSSKEKKGILSCRSGREGGDTRNSTSWDWLQIYLLDLGAAEKKGLIV
jgi:hypothetical protein